MTRWQNWSGEQTCEPQQFLHPSSEDELASMVPSATGVRVVGASHSFSALVPTDATLISLDRMTGLIETDSEKHQATCWAGTPLKQLGRLLWEAGLSLSVQGDVDHQTLGGAIGTGTHGTGKEFGCMSAAVVGFRLLKADGSFINCDANENTEIFQAGRVSLGSLGVMTQIKIQCEPAFHLLQEVRCVPLQECLHGHGEIADRHRHFEFFGFPNTDRVVMKVQDITTEPVRRPWLDLDDFFLRLFSESAQLSPPLSRLLQRVAMRAIPTETMVDRAFDVFPSARKVRFNEIEYAVPQEAFVECYQQLVGFVHDQKMTLGFPFECRWVKADDCWLSPFYNRDAVVISVHRYHKQPYREFFDSMESIFRKFDGRPHWGKMHSLGAERFSEMYPRWTDFCELRKALDPTNKFLNAHLRTVFGESPSRT